jgi:hypothetical protein
LGTRNFQQDFDVILIDIDLSNGIILHPEAVYDGYLPEKYGVYIYNELIRHGFSDDNICFLTGEGETFGSFIDRCQNMFLPKPLYAFEKQEKGFQDMRNWLDSKHSYANFT